MMYKEKQLEESNMKFNVAVEDRAVKPIEDDKVNRIVILQNKEDDNKYILTCGQRESVVRVINNKKQKYDIITTIKAVPNYTYLFSHIRNELLTKAVVYRKEIQLISINQEEFIDTIKSLFDGRRNIDLSKKP